MTIHKNGPTLMEACPHYMLEINKPQWLAKQILGGKTRCI
jgi:hypothetical protein